MSADRRNPWRLAVWVTVALVVIGLVAIGYTLRFPSPTAAPRDAQVAFLAAKASIRSEQENLITRFRKTGTLKNIGHVARDDGKASVHTPILWITVLQDGEILVKALVSIEADKPKKDVYFLFMPRVRAGDAVDWACASYPPALVATACDGSASLP